MLASSLVSTIACALSTADEDYYRVLMLSGEDIPPVVGTNIKDISLFAVFEGELEPIPYQIDEYNQAGAVYFDNWDEPLDGVRGVMDSNDRLLFLFGDSGQRKTASMLTDGKVVAEVELTTNKGEKRYVYVVVGSRLSSDAQHVRYSVAESRVETDFFTMIFDKENQLIWRDFTYADYEGESPIDGMKINFKSGVLSSALEMSFNNENFIAKTVGENVGPIRTSTQLHFTFVYLGIEIIDASIQAHFYPNAMVYDVRLIIPETRRSLIKNPSMSLSVDFNGLQGAQVIADFLPGPLWVDGAMSEAERNAQNVPIVKDKNGLLLKSNKGFDVLTFLDWTGETELPTTFYYQDDPDFQGELDRFKGRFPDAGYKVIEFPEKGLFGYVASVYFSDSFNGSPRELSNYVRTSPSVRVSY